MSFEVRRDPIFKHGNSQNEAWQALDEVHTRYVDPQVSEYKIAMGVCGSKRSHTVNSSRPNSANHVNSKHNSLQN